MENIEQLIQDRIKNLYENTDFALTVFEELVGYAVIAADFDGNILAYNKGAEYIYGYSPSEVIGRQNIEVFFPGDFIESGRFEKIIDELIKKGRFSYEGKRVKKNGEEFCAQILFTVVRNKGNKVVGFVEIVEDLTERKQREGELENAKRTADSASHAKSDFLANMSHELRTPLNSIIGFTEVLEDEFFGTINDKQRQYIGNINTSGKHLLSLINDILDLSKIEAGKVKLEIEELILEKDLLKPSLVMVQERAVKQNIKLSLESKFEADVEIKADLKRLKQVMFNLLSNAVKFTSDGGSVKVTVSLVAVSKLDVAEKGTPDRYVEISVEDTGIGIKNDDMPKLFKEFSQIESVYSKKYEGTGLGLALTKKLVELHGGKIRAESEGEGKGSKFTFTIPLGV